MKTIQILVGIPCSGKTTYSQLICDKPDRHINWIGYVSRDDIRITYDLNQYTKYSEDKVTKIFNEIIEMALNYTYPKVTIILDNTHCKEKYIDEIINKYGRDNKIEIKFFDIPLWKAHYRNIIRYCKIGKWIPIKIMNNMYKNYKQINRKKYAKYECK